MDLFFLSSSLTIIFTSVLSSTLNPYKLVALSGKKIAEALYASLHENTIALDIRNELLVKTLDPDDKRQICYYISRNLHQLGDHNLVYLVEIYTELRERHRELFDYLYDEITDRRTADPGQDKAFRNPENVIPIELESGAKIPEITFVCVARSLDGSLSHFLVSREYNVSDSPRDDYIAGRFLLYGNYMTRISSLFALAEEPATCLSSSINKVEGDYLRRRFQKEPVQKEDDDPLCSLDWSGRTRLCNIVLNSGYFDGQIGFITAHDANDVLFPCTQQIISFRSHEGKLAASKRRYEEWMIRCKPHRFVSSFQSEYFLSQAYKPNEVFVYRWERGVNSTIVLETQLGNIRFGIPIIPSVIPDPKSKGKRKVGEVDEPSSVRIM